MAELVYAMDSKSIALRGLWVRIPPAAYVRPALERQAVDFLAGEGKNASAIARLTGVPRSTVRDWLARPPFEAVVDSSPPNPPAAEYAYLLGMYLGDGSISRGARCYRLRITMDAQYAGVISECAEAMQRVVPRNRVSVVRRRDGSRCVDVSAYSKAWPTLFPQHGPGPKHERQVLLVPWQRMIVEKEPERFVRGLMHSDGSRVLNRVGRRTYPRYFFKQYSEDIRAIFVQVCTQLGVTVSRAGPMQLAVARRRDVEFLDTIVGAKS